MKTIYNYLSEYSMSDYYGFHMPGHKRNRSLIDNGIPYHMDITEINGFDDLHHAEGIIKHAEERVRRLFCADESHFLVNGSTAGILSAVLGVTRKGDKILVARNCHKSVYHAVYMNELQPVYVYPEYRADTGMNGEMVPEKIEKILQEDREIKAVVIVSPTYDGVVSDVEKIAEIVHACGKPLIVDEAHGAHFGFHPYFPENANVKGADVVIHSVHKTLPSLTQTALIHINGEIVDRERVRMYLHMLQSSSPSYILMASIDECMEFLEKKGVDTFARYVDNLKKMRRELGKLKHLRLIDSGNYDFSKLVISVKDTQITSIELTNRLREQYHLEMEMTAGDYILAMTSVGDQEEGFQRFVQALKEIDASLCERENDGKEGAAFGNLPEAEIVFKSSDLVETEMGTYTEWEESKGKISLEYAYLYPPGIPIIVPGERIGSEIISCLKRYRELGFSIEGPKKDGCLKCF